MLHHIGPPSGFVGTFTRTDTLAGKALEEYAATLLAPPPIPLCGISVQVRVMVYEIDKSFRFVGFMITRTNAPGETIEEHPEALFTEPPFRLLIDLG